MTNYLRESFWFNRLPELKQYFDRPPFTELSHSDERQERMLDCGFIGNFSMRFWRLLKVNSLLQDKKTDDIYSDFLLENYLNSVLACADAMATTINHFLRLDFKGADVSLQKTRFIQKVKEVLQAKGITPSPCLDICHEWVKNEVFPYRNIVHHMGGISTYAAINSHDNSFACSLVPRIEAFNFSQMKKDMTGYPSHTAWLIVHNQIRIPNYLTGDRGDADKYYPIDQFFSEWIDKTYNLILCFTEMIVSYQQTKTD